MNIETRGVRCWVLITTLALVSPLVGCDESNPGLDTEVEVKEVRVGQVKSTTLPRTKTVQLEAIVTAVDGTRVDDPQVTWQSSDEAVVTVASDGRLRAVGEGTAAVNVIVGAKSDSKSFSVLDLEGMWQGIYNGSAGVDTIRYTLSHASGTIRGTFRSDNGFPPLTNNNVGSISGDLEGDIFVHTVKVPATPCNLAFDVEMRYEAATGAPSLSPTGTAPLYSDNCSSLNGAITLVRLVRQ